MSRRYDKEDSLVMPKGRTKTNIKYEAQRHTYGQNPCDMMCMFRGWASKAIQGLIAFIKRDDRGRAAMVLISPEKIKQEVVVC